MNISQKRIIEFALSYLKSNLDAEVVSALTGVEDPDEELIAMVEAQIPDELTIYVATIEHEYGVDVLAGLDHETVDKRVFRYVSTWWDQESTSEEEMPEDIHKAIRKYFDLVAKESLSHRDFTVSLK